MKPRNREITIFNLSMLDVICGAVGAFLIITVVLFPSYAKNVRIGEENLKEFRKVRERLAAELERGKQKNHPDLREVEEKNRQLKQALAELRQKKEAKQNSRATTAATVESDLEPVLVAAHGNTGYDVAVEVVPQLPGVPAFDPESKRLWRDPSHYAGTPPSVYDQIEKANVTPKSRLLLVPRPIPGVSYRIYYKLTHSARNEQRTINGELSYANKIWTLPVPTVAPGRGVFVGSFELDREGSLYFSAPNGNMQGAFRNLNRRLLNQLENERKKTKTRIKESTQKS